MRMETVLAVTLFVFLAVTSVQGFARGIVSRQCLQCICDQESYGCTPIGCRMDGGSQSCGYFQIKRDYYIDCGSPGSDWVSCSRDIMCASRCVQAYMRRYGRGQGCHSNCESFARLHNGGPQGCRRSSTDRYWNAIVGQGCSANS
ncbi:hypothetical protein ScPMuIL_001485 [Solemya velum]